MKSMRTKSFLKTFSWVIVGIAIGVASAYLILELGVGVERVKNGIWKTSLVMSSERGNPYTRAWVAKNFLYALNSSEAIYFETDVDDEGRKLDRGYSYKVVGKDLPARWWSITVYGEDNFLIPNEYDKYSVTSANVVRRNGSWTVYISKDPREENWIPLRGEGGFIIVIRLYNPDPAVYENLGKLELPRVIREG